MPLRVVGGPARELSLLSGLGADGRVIGAILLLLALNLLATGLLWRAFRRLRQQLSAPAGVATPARGPAAAAGDASPEDASAQAEREAFYRRASQASTDAIWEWRVGSGGIAWGDAIGERFGYPEARSGTTVDWCLDRIHPDDRAGAIAGVRQALEAGDESWSAEFRFRRADESYAHVLSRARLFRDAAGAPSWVVGAMIDISERKQTEDALRWTASHDPLTGLPNRGFFDRELEAALDARGSEPVGLILLGLDNFTEIKDAWGPAAGDALLRAFAEQLRDLAPAGATAARLGVDEFAIILPRLPAAHANLATVEAIAARLTPSFAFEGAAIDCTASLGAAFAPADGRDRQALLRSASLALYDAKTAGRGAVRVFKEEMRIVIEERAAMILIARDAIADDRIVPFYQAKVDLKTCEIVGFEALLRWHHHRRGLQPPKAIDAAFADMELAARLTDRMIDRVIQDARGWLDRGIEFRRIAINGSAPDFVRGDFAERLLERFHRAGIAPARFELEVTESVFIGQIADNVERILNTLSRAGTTIALDDFGTGYASLSHIKQFPVDTLKIDQSFISARAADDPDDLAIVRAVIGLGQSLGISTVAEGVESLAQVNLLRREGCDVGQGYLFGRAVAAVHVPRVIAELPTLWHIGAGGEIEARVAMPARPGEVSVADL
jgi:diguanylate cyclase (GGDEF)-like protein/PAS domain S-box-containing protein